MMLSECSHQSILTLFNLVLFLMWTSHVSEELPTLCSPFSLCPEYFTECCSAMRCLVSSKGQFEKQLLKTLCGIYR
jgi:hypothetical protein